jgi:hypothetical protein
MKYSEGVAGGVGGRGKGRRDRRERGKLRRK